MVDAVTAFPIFELGHFEAGSAEEKHGLGAEVDAICRATGFLVVSGHGVPKATLYGRRRRPSSRFPSSASSAPGRPILAISRPRPNRESIEARS
jgi:hypothetical protein